VKSQKHSGAAHLIIVIVLVLGLVGSLGYIVWDKVINKEQDSSYIVQVDEDSSNDIQGSNNLVSNNDVEKEKTSLNNEYSGNFYSFEYPKTGWSLKEDNSKQSVTILTSDYKDGPMGVESGSSIDIGQLSFYDSAEQMISSYTAKGMISKLENITVDGQKAYKFACYEFCSYKTIFDKADLSYEIQFSDRTDDSMPVYELVLNTLSVK